MHAAVIDYGLIPPSEFAFGGQRRIGWSYRKFNRMNAGAAQVIDALNIVMGLYEHRHYRELDTLIRLGDRDAGTISIRLGRGPAQAIESDAAS